jgi:hypothetical protein
LNRRLQGLGIVGDQCPDGLAIRPIARSNFVVSGGAPPGDAPLIEVGCKLPNAAGQFAATRKVDGEFRDRA